MQTVARQLGRQRGEVGVAFGPVEARDPVRPGPAGPDRVGCGDRRHPVDRRPAADPGSGQDRHRAIPGRGQAVVEVEPVEPVELGAGHLRLGHERPGLEDDDRSSGLDQRPGHHPAGGAGPDDDDVCVERQRYACLARRGQAERLDRRRVGGRPWVVLDVADRRQVGVRVAAVARVGVGQEAEQAPEGLEGRPAQGQPRATPGEQVLVERRGVEVAEADRPAGQERGSPGATRAGGAPVGAGGPGRDRGQVERLGGQQGSPRRLARDERLGEDGEGLELGLAPATGAAGPVMAAGRRAPNPGPARARSGADGPRGSRGHSRPGSACGAGSSPRR